MWLVVDALYFSCCSINLRQASVLNQVSDYIFFLFILQMLLTNCRYLQIMLTNLCSMRLSLCPHFLSRVLLVERPYLVLMRIGDNHQLKLFGVLENIGWFSVD